MATYEEVYEHIKATGECDEMEGPGELWIGPASMLTWSRQRCSFCEKPFNEGEDYLNWDTGTCCLDLVECAVWKAGKEEREKHEEAVRIRRVEEIVVLPVEERK